GCLDCLVPVKGIDQHHKPLMDPRHQEQNAQIDREERDREQAVLYDPLFLSPSHTFSAHCSTALYPNPRTVTILNPSHPDSLFLSFVIYTSTARRLVSLS